MNTQWLHSTLVSTAVALALLPAATIVLAADVPATKFDLSQFNQAYFDRMRERIQQAGERGIYVSVMLFDGWALQFSPDAWLYHPFHAANNINGIDGDRDVVLGDDFLRRHVDDLLAHVDRTEALEEREDDAQTRVGRFLVAPESFNHTPLVGANDLDAHRDVGDHHNNHDD